MKWAILVGSVDVSGGTYVIFEHAIRALRRGVKVTIVTEAPVIRSQLAWHREAEQLTYKTFDQVRRERFDVAVATWWRTVWELHRVPAKTYAYFVQSIESRFYDESERPLRKLVDSTYMLPLSVITEASWIKRTWPSTTIVQRRWCSTGSAKTSTSPRARPTARGNQGDCGCWWKAHSVCPSRTSSARSRSAVSPKPTRSG